MLRVWGLRKIILVRYYIRGEIKRQTPELREMDLVFCNHEEPTSWVQTWTRLITNCNEMHIEYKPLSVKDFKLGSRSRNTLSVKMLFCQGLWPPAYRCDRLTYMLDWLWELALLSPWRERELLHVFSTASCKPRLLVPYGKLYSAGETSLIMYSSYRI